MTTISVPRDVLERVYDIISSHADRGPPGEGWQSEQLEADCNAIARLLGKKVW